MMCEFSANAAKCKKELLYFIKDRKYYFTELVYDSTLTASVTTGLLLWMKLK